MKRKTVLFVFNGDALCFIHVLLNALDMDARGEEAKIVMEGSSVRLIPELVDEGHALSRLWTQCLDGGLVAGVCRACSGKLGTLEAAKEQGLTLLDDMSGHPSMAAYRAQGYEIITF